MQHHQAMARVPGEAGLTIWRLLRAIRLRLIPVHGLGAVDEAATMAAQVMVLVRGATVLGVAMATVDQITEEAQVTTMGLLGMVRLMVVDQEIIPVRGLALPGVIVGQVMAEGMVLPEADRSMGGDTVHLPIQETRVTVPISMTPTPTLVPEGEYHPLIATTGIAEIVEATNLRIAMLPGEAEVIATGPLYPNPVTPEERMVTRSQSPATETTMRIDLDKKGVPQDGGGRATAALLRERVLLPKPRVPPPMGLVIRHGIFPENRGAD
ncbi:hypothetical protein CCP3SC1_570019 [Gammaproteobacteria bacterium]